MGWKSIAQACDILGWETMKNIALRHNMPIVYLGRRPTISAMELEVWWARLLLEQRQARRKGRPEVWEQNTNTYEEVSIELSKKPREDYYDPEREEACLHALDERNRRK